MGDVSNYVLASTILEEKRLSLARITLHNKHALLYYIYGRRSSSARAIYCERGVAKREGRMGARGV